MDQYEFIRTAHRQYGKGIRQIAREFGHSRKTVRKALAGMAPEYRMSEKRKSPVMGPVREVVDRILIDDRQQPKKQRHTAKRIYDRLVEEYGFQGAESTVRHYIRKRRAELGVETTEAMVPLCPEVYGEAEVDWGEAVVKMGGEARKVKLFCMRPRFSGKPFVRAYPNEAQEMFLDAHVHAFAFYGGVFPVIVYDNLKTAVAKVLKGKQRVEQNQFKLFRAHYTFQAVFCNAARGNEKGGVEGQVKYARRNFLVPIPEVADFEELNKMLLTACEQQNERVLGGREDRRTIAARFEEEAAHLLKLPAAAYVAQKLVSAKVDKYQTVRVEGVRYSVPREFTGRRVEVAVGCEKVGIAWGKAKIAEHQRCFKARAWVLEPQHYLDTLYEKVTAFERAKPIREWRKTWPESHERMLSLMRHHHGERNGGRAFLEVLMLYRKHSRADVEAVVETALEQQIFDGASIRCLLEGLVDDETPPPRLANEHLPEQCRTRHEAPNLSRYDALVEAAS
ncbi:IS21 family transposase [Acanthopleuribacter pedis]